MGVKEHYNSFILRKINVMQSIQYIIIILICSSTTNRLYEVHLKYSCPSISCIVLLDSLWTSQHLHSINRMSIMLRILVSFSIFPEKETFLLTLVVTVKLLSAQFNKCHNCFFKASKLLFHIIIEPQYFLKFSFHNKIML